MAARRQRVEESPRPFRLWHEQEKRVVRYRYYSYRDNADRAALIECRNEKIGVTITVYDATTGRLHGQYTRRIHNVTFLGE